MEGNDYQHLAGRTLLKEPDQTADEMEWALLFNALKQAVEAGKVVEVLKKQICHRQGLDFVFAVNSIEVFSTPHPKAITPEQYMVVWNLTGLIGEAAELADLFLRAVAIGEDRYGWFNEKSMKELGDVLWYVAALCTKYGLYMSQVMEYNIEKLRARYPEGYTSADSTNRKGLAE